MKLTAEQLTKRGRLALEAEQLQYRLLQQFEVAKANLLNEQWEAADRGWSYARILMQRHAVAAARLEGFCSAFPQPKEPRQLTLDETIARKKKR